MTRTKTYPWFLFEKGQKMSGTTYSRGSVAGNIGIRYVFLMRCARLFAQQIHYLSVLFTHAYMLGQKKVRLRRNCTPFWPGWPMRGLQWARGITRERRESGRKTRISLSSLEWWRYRTPWLSSKNTGAFQSYLSPWCFARSLRTVISREFLPESLATVASL